MLSTTSNREQLLDFEVNSRRHNDMIKSTFNGITEDNKKSTNDVDTHDYCRYHSVSPKLLYNTSDNVNKVDTEILRNIMETL